MSAEAPEDRLEKNAASAGRESGSRLPALELKARDATPLERERFVREAAAAGARVYRCRPAGMQTALLEALRGEPEEAAVLFESRELLQFACLSAETHRQAGWEIAAQQMCGCRMGDLRSGRPLPTLEFDIATVAAGVTGADFGLADTGTVVLQASRQRGRLLSLLPPVHLVILEAARVLPDLASFLAHPRGESSALTFITGPSKTADIEQNLAVGVHGPGELHIILVETAAQDY
ncbi:MAG: LUD domain-containing protein [Acidobacteria bacterium]|nr:LUD domain-containing protein [Acidobacteriota bacterium]